MINYKYSNQIDNSNDEKISDLRKYYNYSKLSLEFLHKELIIELFSNENFLKSFIFNKEHLFPFLLGINHYLYNMDKKDKSSIIAENYIGETSIITSTDKSYLDNKGILSDRLNKKFSDVIISINKNHVYLPIDSLVLTNKYFDLVIRNADFTFDDNFVYSEQYLFCDDFSTILTKGKIFEYLNKNYTSFNKFFEDNLDFIKEQYLLIK